MDQEQRIYLSLPPVTAVQSKNGTYASPHLHGETGCFWLGAWSMDSIKRGVFLKVDLHGI